MKYFVVFIIFLTRNAVSSDYENNELIEDDNKVTLQEQLVNARNECAVITNFTTDTPMEIKGNLIDLYDFQEKLEKFSVCFLTKLKLLNPINGAINKLPMGESKSFSDLAITVIIDSCLQRKKSPEATAIHFMRCSHFVY